MDAANDNERLPRTIAEAKQAGETRYFTGKPCKHGHISPRFVSNRRCIACSMLARAEWGRENLDYLRTYARNLPSNAPDIKKERWDAWYADNRDRIVESKRKERASKPGSSYEWARNNREKARANLRNYKARKLGNGGVHTAEDIEDLLRIQNYKCAECGISVKDPKNRHVDHKTPVVKGGSNGKENLQVLCKFCNLSKGAKDQFEFARTKGRLL